MNPPSSMWVVAACSATAAAAVWVVTSQIQIRRAEAKQERKILEAAQEEQESKDLLDLLYSIADDQARKEGYVHRGITCNLCKVGPVRGIRYKCANCIDYDVCEACEAADTHNRNHVFVKIKVPIPPLANPRATLLQPFYPGLKENTGSLSWKIIQHLQENTHFDQVELEALYDQYKSLATVEQGINQKTFDRCLGPLGFCKNLVTERIFKFFDRDEDGIINFVDLASGLSVLCKGTQEEKIIYAFKGYDLNNSGYLSRDELRSMFKAYFLLSMELVRDLVKALEEELMANFNDAGDRPVSSVFTAPIPSSEHPLEGGKGPMVGERDLNTSGIPGQYKLAVSRAQAELAPSLAALSEDAIEDLVQAAFQSADEDGDGKLSFEEFKRWAMTDNTMIAWFDSLGSVF